MSLPPGFLDELRTRVSLSDVVGRKVMWDTRKSQPAKGDHWAPCPFHQEKTASFHVDDRKGFYYCFGCQAKGNVFGFVQETENVSFMEAVEILAREAGMQMPARDPRAQQKSDHHSQLVEVSEAAVQYFRLQLKTSVAAAARAYLQRRGLGQDAVERWEIGFAPQGWQGLWDHLRAKNVAEDLILGAGLAKPSTKGSGKPYDTFRHRIMFPIRAARGRSVAFGGRAMDPNDNAKYLNSPETALFDKGRTLFNHGPARAQAGRDGQPLVVAEGYMDVIALVEAGFDAAVAPLGTAITETQLQMLWRISDEPIVALDGDKAGLNAAMRLIDLALPLLQAGKSLRFAIMPAGQDPDDLLRASGPQAVRDVLDNAQPLVNLLWQRETEGRVFDSPERKAALDKVLGIKVAQIQDQGLRHHYEQAVKDLKWQLFRAKPRAGQAGKKAGQGGGGIGAGGGAGGGGWGRGKTAPALPTSLVKTSALVEGGQSVDRIMRLQVVLASAITTPAVIVEFETQIARMRCEDPDLDRLRRLLLLHGITDPDNLKDHIIGEIGGGGLEKLMRQRHVAISPAVRQPGNEEAARMTLYEELAKLDARDGLTAEMAEAVEDLTDLADESLSWRLRDAAEARNLAQQSLQKDKAVYEVMDNGAQINRVERAKLNDLLARLRRDKPSG
jgi:DNA primase